MEGQFIKMCPRWDKMSQTETSPMGHGGKIMILVLLGTQNNSFHRLLEEIEKSGVSCTKIHFEINLG